MHTSYALKLYSPYNWQLCKRNGLLVNLCIEAGAPAGPGVTCTATGIASWNPCLVCLKSEEECMTSGWASRMITNREWKLLFPHDPTWNLGPAISVSIISKSGTKKLARWNIGSPCAHLIFFTGRKSLLFTRIVATEQFPLTSPCYHGKRHNMTSRSFQGLDLVNTLDELHEIQAMVGGSKLLWGFSAVHIRNLRVWNMSHLQIFICKIPKPGDIGSWKEKATEFLAKSLEWFCLCHLMDPLFAMRYVHFQPKAGRGISHVWQ